MNQLNKTVLMLACALCAAMCATDASAAVVRDIDDHFDDGAIGVNNGAGNGFQIVSNTANGIGSILEDASQAQITSNGNNDNTGIVSNDTLNVTAEDTVTVYWDVIGASGIAANGIELLIQGGTNFREAQALALNLRPNGDARLRLGTSNIETDSVTLGDALDGFTATLVADINGWSLTTESLGGLAMSSGSYGSSTFLDIFNGGRVAATVQRGVMDVDQITVSVVGPIPEPATATLALLGAAGLLRRRRVA